MYHREDVLQTTVYHADLDTQVPALIDYSYDLNTHEITVESVQIDINNNQEWVLYPKYNEDEAWTKCAQAEKVE